MADIAARENYLSIAFASSTAPSSEFTRAMMNDVSKSFNHSRLLSRSEVIVSDSRICLIASSRSTRLIVFLPAMSDISLFLKFLFITDEKLSFGNFDFFKSL